MSPWEAKFGLSWLTVLWAVTGAYLFFLGLAAFVSGAAAGGLVAIGGLFLLVLWAIWFIVGRNPYQRSPWSL